MCFNIVSCKSNGGSFAGFDLNLPILAMCGEDDLRFAMKPKGENQKDIIDVNGSKVALLYVHTLEDGDAATISFGLNGDDLVMGGQIYDEKFDIVAEQYIIADRDEVLELIKDIDGEAGYEWLKNFLGK